MKALIAQLIPVLNEQEKQDILAYYTVYEKYIDEITVDSMEGLKDHPVFGKLITEMPEEVREANTKISRQLQTDAIMHNNWQPYVEYSIQQGIAYAKMGLTIKSWFELITIGRNYIMPYLQKEYGNGTQLLSSINGLNLLIDIGMAVIGEAYLQEKKEIIEDDRNQIKKLNEELEQKVTDRTNKLTTANVELGQFIYVASHDLQEPLRTISNFVGLIQEKYVGKLDDDADQYFKFISNGTAKMQQLIKDLLDLSKIGKEVKFTVVDCNKILEQVLLELAVSIKESGAIISSTTLPILKGSETELKQLFQNLISNAIKFRKPDTVPQLDISVEEKPNEYLFAFKNNGIGIEDKHKEKIFVIFQRLHSASEYPGTGIGLATCKKVVEQHNGKIWVESELGQGSTFYFTISKENLN